MLKNSVFEIELQDCEIEHSNKDINFMYNITVGHYIGREHIYTVEGLVIQLVSKNKHILDFKHSRSDRIHGKKPRFTMSEAVFKQVFAATMQMLNEDIRKAEYGCNEGEWILHSLIKSSNTGKETTWFVNPMNGQIKEKLDVNNLFRSDEQDTERPSIQKLFRED